MIVYRIRDKETGLFSDGKSNPQFNKTGKVWTHAGGLTRHINAIAHLYPSKYQGCEIVDYELREAGCYRDISNFDLYGPE